MTECATYPDLFPACKSRKIEVDFEGGDITSDAGSLLLRQVDRKLGLTRDLNKALHDPRSKGSCEHSQLSLYRQRIYGLALGYEDLNDHSTLRDDLALQTAVESDKSLASSPTLCRLENRADREAAKEISMLIVEKFIASFKKAPTRLVLDFDATDDPVHGQQEGRFFHGYYDHYCFLPLYVFCGSQLLAAYRKQWPKVEIIFRGDSGSCHNWWPNQLRLLLSSLAYILIESMRRLALRGTELARAQCGTIRLKLLKIGAVVTRNTRRVRMHLASGCPYKPLFWHAARHLALE